MTNTPKSPGNQSGIQGLAARRTAVNMLTRVIDDHQTLDQLTDPATGLKHFLELDTRDQSLAKAIIITCLRNYRRIGHVLAKLYDRKPPQRARFLIHSIEIAAAQILYMDVPASAAVNLAITMIRSDRRTQRFAGFANAVLRKLERERESLLAASVDIHPFPNWLYKKLTSDHGKEKTLLTGKIIGQRPTIDLTLKNNSAELPEKFSKEIEAIRLPTGSLRLTSDIPIQDLPGFKEGNWWVQDISASLPAKLLGNIEGKKIADLCAAPGGKTMQLASSGAIVTAVDQSEKRLKRLTQNLDRTKLNAKCEAVNILKWNTGEKFDAVLLDAPCTATGTARRHPDVLWNKTPEDVDALVALQISLIQASLAILKAGGTLIYANCSLLKDEGENLIAKLDLPGLKPDPVRPEELPGLEFCVNGQGNVRCLPHYLEQENKAHCGMDGFFIARFVVSRPN